MALGGKPRAFVCMQKRPTVIRSEKVAMVEAIGEQLERSTMAVLADYRGLTVGQMASLRRQLQPAQAELRVAKNTLARLAVSGTPREVLLPSLEGPTAFVFGFGDPAQVAKALTEAIRTQRLTVRIKSALLGDRLLAPSDVNRLAELPPREQLLAQLVGQVQAPVSGLVGVLAGVLQGFVGVLEVRRQQLEEA